MTSRELLEEKLMQAESNIVPITIEDYTLFRSCGIDYKNTLTYNAQAVNGWNQKWPSHHRLGLKYYDRKNLASMGYFQRYTGSSHLHLIPCEAATEKVRELAELLFEFSQSPVYIKKISLQQREALLVTPGFQDVHPKNGWYAEAPLEDDTFPEQILDVEVTLAELQKKRKDSQLKDKYVRAVRRYGKPGKLRIEPYFADDPEQQKIALDVVNGFFQIQREKENHLSQPEDYYNLITIQPKHTIYWSSLVYIDDVPAGFYFAEKGKGGFAHVYAHIALHDQFPYLSEFLLVHLLEKVYRTGVNFANLGGSETAGLHQFKQKCKPVREEQKYWVLYDGKIKME